MSTIKVDTIKNTSNVEVFTAKAWVNFNGTWTSGDPIRASGNVSSIVDNGTGDYTVNFATAMSDADYAINVSGGTGATVGAGTEFTIAAAPKRGYAPSTNSVRVGFVNNGNSAAYDFAYISVAIFR
jgi:hypothetical protein